ncbi:MAG: rane fusion protein multidrug efflux system [Desulfuromonadales bacterium]|nr:rane fusion protein multidrug efflux system [Desulfuromonadales bacterium]
MKSRFWIRVVAPIVILLAGVAIMALLIYLRKAPPRQPKENPGILVDVMIGRARKHRVQVAVTGTVQPRREARITPQVSGKVTWMNPRFIAGGFFAEGEQMFRIEDVDYRLAVEQATAQRARAELDLLTVQSQARIARREWQRLNAGGKEEPNPLVVYEPQLKNARATLAAAEAAVSKARLELERTVVRAPFNCLVRSEQVDIGQYLTAGVTVGQVFGTDRAEIIVPLPLEELVWLQVPRFEGQKPGAQAQIIMDGGRREYVWQGRVVRSLGEVDARGRMARLVVSVDDPFYLKKPAPDDRPPLSPGLFVDIRIDGRILDDIVPVPREAVHEGDVVWVAGDDGLLHIRRIEVARRERKQVLVSGGIEDGERIVLTLLSGVADGLKLRIAPAEARP